MSKAEWGAKHSCASCGVRFYDLQRATIHCPKCGTLFVPAAERPQRPSGGTRVSARSARRLDASSAHADIQRSNWSPDIHSSQAADEDEVDVDEAEDDEPDVDEDSEPDPPEAPESR